MSGGVESIAELKKAVKNLTLADASSGNLMYNSGIQQALDLINSFEASVKKRIKTLENDWLSNLRFVDNVKELRRVLGEELLPKSSIKSGEVDEK